MRSASKRASVAGQHILPPRGRLLAHASVVPGKDANRHVEERDPLCNRSGGDGWEDKPEIPVAHVCQAVAQADVVTTEVSLDPIGYDAEPTVVGEPAKRRSEAADQGYELLGRARNCCDQLA
jgi:hypothetical protein